MMKEEDITHLDTLVFANLIGWTPIEVRNRFKEIREGEGKYLNPNTGKLQENYQKQRAYPFIKELHY